MSERNGRPLGVIEALVSVRDQCPHAAEREHAARALQAIQAGGAGALREQSSLVLSTIAGWRGERADAVKRALNRFLEETPAPGEPSGKAAPEEEEREWSRSG